MSGDILSGCHNLEGRVLQASHGQRPEMLLNIVQAQDEGSLHSGIAQPQVSTTLMLRNSGLDLKKVC